MVQYRDVNNGYQTILELHKKLDEMNIKHDLERIFDGWKIVTPSGNVSEHKYTYGNDYDLMEISGFGLKNNSVRGFITIPEALQFIAG